MSLRLFARALDSSSSLSCGRLRVFLALSKDSELLPAKGECSGGSCLRAPVNSRSLSPVSPVGNGVRLLPRLEDWSFFFRECWRLRLCCDVAMLCTNPTDPFGSFRSFRPTTVGDLRRRRRSREGERFARFFFDIMTE